MNQRTAWKLILITAGALGAFAAHSRAQSQVHVPTWALRGTATFHGPSPQEVELSSDDEELTLGELVDRWSRAEGHSVALSEQARSRLDATDTGLTGLIVVPAGRVRGLVEDLLLWNGFVVSRIRDEAPRVFGIHDARADDGHNARFVSMEPEELLARPELAALLVETVAITEGLDARQTTNSMRALMRPVWYDSALSARGDAILLRGAAADVRARLGWIAELSRAAQVENRVEREQSVVDVAGVVPAAGAAEAQDDRDQAVEPAPISAAGLLTEFAPLLDGPSAVRSVRFQGRTAKGSETTLRVALELTATAADDAAAARSLFEDRERFSALPGARFAQRGAPYFGDARGEASLACLLEYDRPAPVFGRRSERDPLLVVVEAFQETVPSWRVKCRELAASSRSVGYDRWSVEPFDPQPRHVQETPSVAAVAAFLEQLERDTGSVVTDLELRREANGFRLDGFRLARPQEAAGLDGADELDSELSGRGAELAD